MKTRNLPAAALVSVALALLVSSQLSAQTDETKSDGTTRYEKKSTGTRELVGVGGLTIKMLVEAVNLGGAEVEVGEITFPAGTRGADHRHGSIEIFYVLSGTMDHVVDGVSHVLEPGMVGIVRPGDSVAHRVVSEEPVRALVIWAPGGESDRLARVFEERAIE